MSGTYHERHLRLVSRDIDGELETEERRRLEEHLKSCAGCRRAAEQLRLFSSTMRRFGEAPAARPRRVGGLAIGGDGRSLRVSVVPPEGPLRLLRAVAAAAAVLLIVFGAMALGPLWRLPRLDAAPAARSGERVLTILLWEKDPGRAVERATNGFMREIQPREGLYRLDAGPIQGSRPDSPPTGLDSRPVEDR